MANVDRPRGFTPVKYTSGAPWTGQCRAIAPKDGVDIYIGDALTLDTGTADKAATNDSAFLGVCVGVGKKDALTGSVTGAYNPGNLNEIWYDDSDHTNTDFVIFYVPAEDMIFEVQSAVDLSAYVVGSTADITGTGGSTAGRSNQEITTSNNTDVVIVEIPDTVGNDKTAVNASYYVQFITSAFAQ